MEPTFSSESSASVDHLRAGEFPARQETMVLLSGQNLPAGRVVGRIALGAPSSAAKSGGNTGNGTFVLDATTPVKTGAKAGVYALRVVVLHAAHDYSVELQDPDGTSLGTQRLTGTGASITIDDDIKGVLTDGSTDFIVGDGFDITIAAGSGKIKEAVAAALDGSAKPIGILAKACDASGGDKDASVYVTGEFRKNKLSYGAGHSAATVEADLKTLNIYLNDSVSA